MDAQHLLHELEILIPKSSLNQKALIDIYAKNEVYSGLRSMFRLFPRYTLVETTDREKFRKLRYSRYLINENARTAFPSNWHNLYVIAKTHPVVKFTRTGIVFARNSPAEYAAYLKLKIREKTPKVP